MDFSNLNKNQLEAVNHTEGPVLILAGPGTGKTFTIVKRVANLIINKSVDPESILVTTFTKKAANELKFRISLELKESGIPIDIDRMRIGTLHSIFQEIIEAENYILLDDFEQRYLLYKNSNFFESVTGFKEFIENLRSNSSLPISSMIAYFSKLAEHKISNAELTLSNNREIQLLGIFYAAYQTLLDKNSAIDFAKIQTLCLEKLEHDKEFLKKITDEINYIIIDEYQDTNKIQNDIIFKLAEIKKNICVVGDDDQSIYRFRGATVENILNFPKSFVENECKIITLNQNYRSHPDIINFYSEFIRQKNWQKKDEQEKNSEQKNHEENLENFGAEKNKNNFGRMEKFLFSDIGEDKEDEKNHVPRVMKISGKNNSEYTKNIAEFLKYLKEKNIVDDYSQIVFLSSSARFSDFGIIINQLNQAGIKTYSPRTGEFFQRDEIKMFIGLAIIFYKEYFAKLKNEQDFSYEPHHVYYNHCREFLKNYTLNYEREISRWLKIRLEQEEEQEKENREKNSDQEKNMGKKFLPIFYEFFKFEYFKDLFKEKNINAKECELREKNISILAQKIFDYEEKYGSIFSEDFFETYLPFLIEFGINEFEDDEEKVLEEHVSFLTLHQSKGLEFPIVFITDLIKEPIKNEYNKFKQLVNEEVYKISQQKFEEESLEDFYRLYYTGFSRAKNFLFLASIDNRDKKMKKQAPSVFFEKTFDALPDYKIYEEKLSSQMIDRSKSHLSRKRFSFTADVALYLQCPIKYRFLRYTKFPIIDTEKELLGTFIHKTIDSIHRDILKKIPVTETRVKYHLKKNQELISMKNHKIFSEEEIQKAFKDIFAYISHESEALIYIKESELSLSVIREKYILHGTLDLVNEKKGEHEIVDFKTSAIKPEKISENYERQLYIYDYLCNSNNYNVKNLKLYYTSDHENPIFEMQKIPQKQKEVLQEFDLTVENILEKKFFDKTLQKQNCKNCQFRFYCGEEN
ncbi:MAG: ATP-dependent DNA helicase [Fusobacteriaceae bacterium]